jgi:hypothetical protein
MRRDKVRKLVFRTISQIGIAYRGSPLSEALPGLPDAAPRAGDRFPWMRLKLSADGPVEDLFQKLDDTRFHLILIGQGASSTEEAGPGEILLTHVIPSDPGNERELARANVPTPSFYLLRPDGHVGLSGPRLEAGAVARYFSERLGLDARALRPGRAR